MKRKRKKRVFVFEKCNIGYIFQKTAVKSRYRCTHYKGF